MCTVCVFLKIFHGSFCRTLSSDFQTAPDVHLFFTSGYFLSSGAWTQPPLPLVLTIVTTSLLPAQWYQQNLWDQKTVSAPFHFSQETSLSLWESSKELQILCLLSSLYGYMAALGRISAVPHLNESAGESDWSRCFCVSFWIRPGYGHTAYNAIQRSYRVCFHLCIQYLPFRRAILQTFFMILRILHFLVVLVVIRKAQLWKGKHIAFWWSGKRLPSNHSFSLIAFEKMTQCIVISCKILNDVENPLEILLRCG